MTANKKTRFKPRDYQVYYVQKAKDQNSIICLGTGSGKTYISIMLFKEFGKQLRRDGKKAIFLSPTVVLAQQQAEEIKKHTNFRVKVFYGSLGVDAWSKDDWKTQIDSVHILVLTPDLGYRILTKKYIDMTRIAVLVVDECHHAGLKIGSKTKVVESNSPYKRIMTYIANRQMADRMRIVGLTASVINACHDLVNLSDCFNHLEEIFNAKILGEFDFDPRHLAEPTISSWIFRESIQLNPQFKQLLTISDQLDKEIKEQKKLEASKRFKVAWNQYYLAERPLVKPSYIVRMLRDIVHVQAELGVYSAYLVCKQFGEELQMMLDSMRQEEDQKMFYITIATIKLLSYLEQSYAYTIETFKSQFGIDQAIQWTSTSKMLRLLDIIFCFNDRGSENVDSENEQKFSALIFVDRVLYAFAISRFLEHLSETNAFSYLKPDFFVGINSELQQFKFIKEAHKRSARTIASFKEGAVNVLVCTSVLEEGIDIGCCNLVIRFSPITNYRSYTQSKGRGRAKDSHFCILSNEEKELEMQIKSFELIEKFLNTKFKQSKQEDAIGIRPQRLLQLSGGDEYFESRTGAQISLHEARNYLETYIAKKGNRAYHVDYSVEEVEQGGFVFKLMLRGVCPLKDEVIGKVCSTKELAFQSACLNAIKQLYEDGQLDERFRAISNETIVSRCNLIKREYDESEKAESKFVFNESIKKRLMFEKQLGNAKYFERFVKSTGGHDLYEVSFHSNDAYLKQTDNRRLALLTKLQLIPECLCTRVYGSVYDADVKLTLIRQNIALSANELDQIGKFTLSVFKTAVPLFKKRTDLQFDLDGCLFKFAFIGPDKSIEFGQMHKIVNLEEGDLEGADNLVRAVHTNTDYKLVNYHTAVLPSDTFYYAPEQKQITYNEYFKMKYQIEIQNQQETLLQVEPAGLNACYSVFCKKEHGEVNEEKKAKFQVFLPKELCVISTVTKSLYKQLTALLPAIYRMKQQFILKHIAVSLNREILNVTDGCRPDFDDSIFSEGSAFDFEPFKKKQRILAKLPEDDGLEEEYDSEASEDSGLGDVVDRSELNSPTRELIRQAKIRTTHRFDEHIKHVSVEQDYLDETLLQAVQSVLKTTTHPDLNDALMAFANGFRDMIHMSGKPSGLKSFRDSNDEVHKPVMRASDELSRLDFNQWTIGSSKSVIDRALLQEALTAKSAADESNLEVLEFLGDTYLKFITCCLLFHLHPDAPVGELDILKMCAVSNRNLYVLSRRKQIYRFMFASNFLPGITMMPDGCSYTDAIKDQCAGDLSVILVDSGGFSRSKMNLVDRNRYQELGCKSVSDSMESLIGATLLSSGHRTACLFMKFIGIYSDEFKIDTNCTQENWFSTKDGRKYDPLALDPEGRKVDFVREMWEKFQFDALEQQIGYVFRNKALLVQAFKHHSYVRLNEFPSYENLEFLGDAVIDYLIGKCCVDDPAKFTPGQLTDLKQSLINNNFFGTISVKYGLQDYLIYSSVDIFNIIGEYKVFYNNTFGSKGSDTLIIPSNYLILSEPDSLLIEHIEAPKILADIFESLMAAVFLDSNFDLNVVWSVLHKFLANELIKFRQCPPKTYIAHVTEMFPEARFGKSRTSGQLTQVDITIDGQLYTGEGANKRQARMEASRKVLKSYAKLT